MTIIHISEKLQIIKNKYNTHKDKHWELINNLNLYATIFVNSLNFMKNNNLMVYYLNK